MYCCIALYVYRFVVIIRTSILECLLKETLVRVEDVGIFAAKTAHHGPQLQNVLGSCNVMMTLVFSDGAINNLLL